MRRRKPNRLRWILLVLFSSSVFAGAAVAQEDEGYLEPRPGPWLVNRPADLYTRPSADARVLLTLRPNTVVEVVDVTDQWLEVRSRTGKPNGFIRRSYAEPFRGRREARRPAVTGTFRLTDPVIVRRAPDMDSERVTTLPAGTEVRVVGQSGNWYRIESESGNRPPGYIPTISARRVSD